MSSVETKYFGAVSAETGVVIEFPAGLPAFERERLFLAIEHPRTEPFVLLQSMCTRELCFLALPVSAVEPAYRLQMSDEDLDALQLDRAANQVSAEDIAALALVVVGPDGRMSANLMSPVVVNRRNRRAIQSVRWDGAYAHNHPVELPVLAAGTEGPLCS
jgi:flagellar assembly factor FliW